MPGNIPIEEQDKLCREAGFPTITEQQEYWNNKEAADREKANLLRAVDAMAVFLDEMNKSTAKLRMEFEKLARTYQPKDEDLSPA
jgi:hypothetical protein